MANWFECKAQYDKMMENGALKKVTEPYMVDALSFTEAEARIIEEMIPYVSGELTIAAVNRRQSGDGQLIDPGGGAGGRSAHAGNHRGEVYHLAQNHVRLCRSGNADHARRDEDGNHSCAGHYG